MMHPSLSQTRAKKADSGSLANCAAETSLQHAIRQGLVLVEGHPFRGEFRGDGKFTNFLRQFGLF